MVHSYRCDCDKSNGDWIKQVTTEDLMKFGIPICANCLNPMEPYQEKITVDRIRLNVSVNGRKLKIKSFDVNEYGIIHVVYYMDGHHTKWVFAKDVEISVETIKG